MATPKKTPAVGDRAKESDEPLPAIVKSMLAAGSLPPPAAFWTAVIEKECRATFDDHPLPSDAAVRQAAAKLNVPQDAVRHLWAARFPQIPFSPVAIREFAATLGISEPEVDEMTLREFSELLCKSDNTGDLTAPLTQTELGKAFRCHRNQVKTLVLARYYYQKVGSR